MLLLLISLHTKTQQWSGVPPPPHLLCPHSTASPTLHFVLFFPHSRPCFVSAPSLGGPRLGKLLGRRFAVWTHPVVVLQPGGGEGEVEEEKPLYSVCSVCCSKQAEFRAKMLLCSCSRELLPNDESHKTNRTLESMHFQFLRWMFP